MLRRLRVTCRPRPSPPTRSASATGRSTSATGAWTGCDGRRETLTRGEYDLLAALARQPGVAVGRERLMQAVFHRSWDPSDRTIDVLVSRLRDKLEADPRHPS